MIKQIYLPQAPHKANWIDSNFVVFGFDNSAQCCEHFGYAVYDPATGAQIAESPDNLPYTFDFESGTKTYNPSDNPPIVPYFLDRDRKRLKDTSDVVDIFQVKLIPDDPYEDSELVFECFNMHNGFYFHDFSIEKLKSTPPTTEA